MQSLRCTWNIQVEMCFKPKVVWVRDNGCSVTALSNHDGMRRPRWTVVNEKSSGQRKASWKTSNISYDDRRRGCYQDWRKSHGAGEADSTEAKGIKFPEAVGDRYCRMQQRGHPLNWRMKSVHVIEQLEGHKYANWLDFLVADIWIHSSCIKHKSIYWRVLDKVHNL